jgi:hypothetical protein
MASQHLGFPKSMFTYQLSARQFGSKGTDELVMLEVYDNLRRPVENEDSDAIEAPGDQPQ